MKTCSQCKKVKKFEDYYKDGRTKDGCYSACKECHQNKRYPTGYRWTIKIRQDIRITPKPEDVAYTMFLAINSRILSKRKCYRHVKCLLSLNELELFIRKNWETYLHLYDIWKANNFSRKYVPSLDRINSKGHYQIGNLQIIPFHENASRANLGRKQTDEHVQKRVTAIKQFYVNQHDPHQVHPHRRGEE